jgi:transcriptional regulator with XRE-family HTH domain
MEEKQMKNATELFGGRIRELRKVQRLTQEQLAEFLGIEQKHVSLIEQGKSYPSLDRLMRIAEVLKVPLPSLFDFAHHDPEAILPELMLKNLEEVDEKDRQLLYRITDWMKERRG